MKGKNAISAIEALRRRSPENPVLKYSSSLDDITEDIGNKICKLRSRGMSKKAIAKKIHKSDRYVAAVLDYHYVALELPKVMTKAAKKRLAEARKAMRRDEMKK